MPDIRSTNVPGRSPGTISAVGHVRSLPRDLAPPRRIVGHDAGASPAPRGPSLRYGRDMVGPSAGGHSRWHLRWGDLGRAVLGIVGATLGLVIASWVLPGFDVGGWEDALVTAVLVAVIGALLRVLLVEGAIRLGWVGSILLGLLGQALAVWLVVYAPKGLDAADLGLGAARLVDHRVRLDVLRLGRDRRHRRRGDRVPAAAGPTRTRVTLADPDVPGIVFVQADGVPYPVLDWCVRAGTLPTLSRWIRSGSHRAVEWRPKLPATTPASQMGILHGTIDGIPAFRWVDRATGKVYVANRPGRRRGDRGDALATVSDCSPTTGSRSATSSPATRPRRTPR